jgi:hypothetical protein
MSETQCEQLQPVDEVLSLEEAKVAFMLLEGRIAALNEHFDHLLAATLTRELTAVSTTSHAPHGT